MTPNSRFRENRFSVKSYVDVPSDIQALTQSEFFDSIDLEKFVQENTNGLLTPNLFRDGALICNADNVRAVRTKNEDLVHGEFATLSNLSTIRQFVSRYGFLSAVDELPSAWIGGQEYVVEPTSHWYQSIVKVAFAIALIGLRRNMDKRRIEDLVGGIYGPHRLAYMARWFGDRFELELIIPSLFFGSSPTEVVIRNQVRTASGAVLIGNSRGEVIDPELVTQLGELGLAYQYVSDEISRVIKPNLKFGSLSKDFLSARLSSRGLRTAIWLQLWEDLMGRRDLVRCEWCSKFFVLSNLTHRFCNSTCRQASGRAAKKGK